MERVEHVINTYEKKSSTLMDGGHMTMIMLQSSTHFTYARSDCMSIVDHLLNRTGRNESRHKVQH